MQVTNFQDAIALMRTGLYVCVAWPYAQNDKLVWVFRELNRATK